MRSDSESVMKEFKVSLSDEEEGLLDKIEALLKVDEKVMLILAPSALIANLESDYVPRQSGVFVLTDKRIFFIHKDKKEGHVIYNYSIDKLGTISYDKGLRFGRGSLSIPTPDRFFDFAVPNRRLDSYREVFDKVKQSYTWEHSSEYRNMNLSERKSRLASSIRKRSVQENDENRKDSPVVE